MSFSQLIQVGILRQRMRIIKPRCATCWCTQEWSFDIFIAILKSAVSSASRRNRMQNLVVEEGTQLHVALEIVNDLLFDLRQAIPCIF